ncbi:hypothetical protein FHS29_005522 [Saccharothrix tamanrassetensis]|uniref:Uncharacterized protein n=1 Tax=Saccharothrix tamanrassetensis TaxID=1051531 RepID=A0A841CPS3_9PSEU|nr:hypothetical protein [Saccharothrix tamanrassetensis]MBB5958913.1 hypothetical protein [Saccharothrix tamanrassetensis]
MIPPWPAMMAMAGKLVRGMRFKRTTRAVIASAVAVTMAMAVTGPAAAAEDFSGRFTNHLANPKPDFLLTLRDTHVPQGIAYWRGDGHGARFFVTYYDPSDRSNTRLAVHGAEGRYLKAVKINGEHVGGVVAWREWLYTIDTVSSSGTTLLRRYRLSDIATTGHGEALPQRDVEQLPTGAGAFLTIHDDKLYFGSHTKDRHYTEHGKLYTWPMNTASGNPTPSPAQWGASIGIPGNVQGLVVTANHFVFSQSWDRDCWSRITVRERGEGFAGDRFIYAPAMSEGIVNAAGSLYVNFESGADVPPDHHYARTARNVVHRPWFGSLTTFITDIQANGRRINDRSPYECVAG